MSRVSVWYHATPKRNLKSILREGLGSTTPSAFSYSGRLADRGKIYLTGGRDAAEGFAEDAYYVTSRVPRYWAILEVKLPTSASLASDPGMDSPSEPLDRAVIYSGVIPPGSLRLVGYYDARVGERIRLGWKESY